MGKLQISLHQTLSPCIKGGVLAIYKNTWDSGHYFNKEFNK